MISVCISIYNYYAYPLVRRLTNQMGKLPEGSFEVVCIDDCSSGYYLNQNMGICGQATYLRLKQHVGRARVRNLFLKYAKGDWMLFLDSDSLVPDNFLKVYAAYSGKKADVVVGGRSFDQRGNDSDHRLRYLYGQAVESLPAEKRAERPYRTFTACNFMIRRQVFERVKYDPRQTKSGFEDAFFIYRLELDKATVQHVDNAVVKGYMETNVEFVHKTVECMESLAEVYGFMWEDQHFCRVVEPVATYNRLRRVGLLGVSYGLFRLMRRSIESHFATGKALSLKQFEFYKLGIFVQQLREGDRGNKNEKLTIK